jgi:hypothetical protein
MTRWIVIGCAGVVATGLLVRVLAGTGGGQGDAPAPARVRTEIDATGAAGGNAAVAAPPAPSPAVRELQRRLLVDDTLTPPSPTATAEEKTAYERTVNAIAQGKDPLVPATVPPPATAVRDTAAPAISVDPVALRQRLEDRRKAAVEQIRKRRDEKREEHATRIRKIMETNAPPPPDPNRPKPAPLFEPPKLGPAVTGVDGKEPKPKQPQ